MLGQDATGLTTEQVQAQRRRFGFNDIVVETANPWITVVAESFKDPMIWFLLGTSLLFALLGQTTEALTLLFAVLPLLAMGLFLHRRTAASSAGLASRLASTAIILRDGEWRQLPSREVVPGDVAKVSPGEYFPADGVLIRGEGLQVDESTLTGESLPVAKAAWRSTSNMTFATALHQAVAGTRLLTGHAILKVESIGQETHYGRIVASVRDTVVHNTPLQQAIAEMVKILLFAALLLCILLGCLRWWQGHGWVDALISAVTLAVAAIPEEFPVVYTFMLGLGVYRLARKKALVRRAVAVENIGRTTCIVSDKTGTMTLGELVFAGVKASAHSTPEDVLTLATMAARPDSGDPMDQALHAACKAPLTGHKVADFPFAEARRRETSIWSIDAETVAVTKGAPETLWAVCALSQEEQTYWQEQLDVLAQQGHKVIGCARKTMTADRPCVEPSDHMEWMGLLSFVDPVKEGVKAAVASCVASGVRVIMVTGDHPKTATAIAKSIDLGHLEPRVTVLRADAQPDEIESAVARTDVFARATPAQKFQIVQALQAQGHIVSVTGDGVNDVPALRKADIGVAMGLRGTQSAREVSPIVLMDDNFGTLPAAIFEGRELFQNLRLAFVYLLLVHIPLVMGATVIPMLGYPLLFMPIHIVWLELLIHPTAMLAFQNVPLEKHTLAQLSKNSIHFFNTSTWWWIALGGGILGLMMVTSFVWGLSDLVQVEHARSLALGILIVSSAGLTLGLAGTSSKMTLGCAMASVMSFVTLAQTPSLNTVVQLSTLNWADVSGLMGVGVLSAWLASRVQRRLVIED